MKEWQRINPGGKTKEEFEKGEILHGGLPVSAEKLTQGLEQVRKIKIAELKGREQEKGIKEAPKNLEEIEFIGMVQMMISKERERLGLLPGFHVELERTQLFHSDTWQLRENYQSNHRGEYKILEGLAEAQTKSPDNKIVSPYAHFRTISHELLHQSSYYEADPLDGNMRRRLGYFTGKDGLGLALNEAMTEGVNQQLLGQHEAVLGTRFSEGIGGKPYKWWSEVSTYQSYQKIVRIVAQRVDDALYQGVSKTWDNLERGYFDGDQKALQDIEKALGKETLELLLLLGNPALFDTDDKDPRTSYWYIEHLIEKFLSGFSSPNALLSTSQRDQIYQEVLSRKKKLEGPTPGDVTNK